MVAAYFRELTTAAWRGWNRFWFTPADPATLGLIRICAGAMLFYTHLVWSFDLAAFFGPNSWLDREFLEQLQRGSLVGSHLWWCETPAALWTVHVLALAVFALFTVGLATRTTGVLAYLLTISYAHRTPMAMYGLDQINTYLSLYLALGPSGAAYSLDRWLKTRGQRLATPAGPAGPSVSANIAVRLMQVHLCVMYFFAGISKLQGPAWWQGTALWGAVANLEYQSLNLVWLVHMPLLVNLLTQVTVFWELFYCVLIWHRLTRPLMLAVALPLHLGIGLGMGMPTFGLVMLFANLSFFEPTFVRRLLSHRGPASRPSVPTTHALPGAPHIAGLSRQRVSHSD